MTDQDGASRKNKIVVDLAAPKAAPPPPPAVTHPETPAGPAGEGGAGEKLSFAELQARLTHPQPADPHVTAPAAAAPPAAAAAPAAVADDDEKTRKDPKAAKHRGVLASDYEGPSYSELRKRAQASGPDDNRLALPVGYMLHEYCIERVLGIGGFGVSYLAHDTNLNAKVAIKEYLPNDLAVRNEETGAVLPKSSRDQEDYAIGLDRFLLESRTLATFRHANIVRVTRFFEFGNTAYMVMDYEFGESLNSWLKQRTDGGGATPDEAQLVQMFVPLLQGLEKVHEAGFLHRDIKPANIYVRDSDGSLVLLDFGAARQTSASTSENGMTSIVTPGYAPFEQYHAHGHQGPWSDLYAMGGVLYWFVAGRKPVEAAARIQNDPQEPAVTVGAGKYSVKFLQAIDWALAPDPEKRPQSVAELLPALKGDGAAPARGPAAAGTRSRRRLLGAAIGAVVVLIAAGGLWATLGGKHSAPSGGALTLQLHTGAMSQSKAETDEWLASVQPLADQVGIALDQSVRIERVGSFDSQLKARAPTADLYLAGSDKIGLMVRELHLTPVVKFRDFGVVFFTKPSSGVTKLADLPGKKLAVYPADSGHGPLMIQWLLVNDVAPDRVNLRISNDPDRMVDALFYGGVDAVAIPLYAAADVQARYGSRLVVLSRSTPSPGYVLAASPRLPQAQVASLQTAMLALPASPEGAAALKALRLSQLAATAELSPVLASEVVKQAERTQRARSLYPATAIALENKQEK